MTGCSANPKMARNSVTSLYLSKCVLGVALCLAVTCLSLGLIVWTYTDNRLEFEQANATSLCTMTNGVCESLHPIMDIQLLQFFISLVNKLLLLRSGNVEANPGPKYEVATGIQLEHLTKEISKHIGTSWKNLSRSIGFTKTDIDSIEHRDKDDLKENICQFFYEWKRQKGNDATASSLISAAENAGLLDLLTKLEEKKFVCRKGSPLQSRKRPHSPNTFDPPLKDGNGLLDTFQSRFKTLVDETYDFLKQQKTSADDFYVKFSSTPLPLRKTSRTVIKKCFPGPEMRTETWLRDTWLKLNDRWWDFLNYELLEHIVRSFVPRDHPLLERMTLYSKDIEKFSTSTKVSNFYDNWPRGVQKPDKEYMTTVVTKVNVSWEQCTLQNVKDKSLALTQKFFLPGGVFKVRNAKKGCVSVEWYVPITVAELIKENVPHSKFFEENKLISMRVDNVYIYSIVQAEFSNYLRDIYRRGLLSHTTPDPMPFRLAKIEREKIIYHFQADEFTKGTIRGDPDDIWFKKSPFESFDQLGFLSDGSLASLVLIEGAPGSGKTTLSRQFCQQWEEGKLYPELPSLVFILIHLRDHGINDIKNLRDFFAFTNYATESVVEEAEACEGTGFVFWLDGWDELSDSQKEDSSILKQLVCGEILPKSTVFVTSRPWGADDVKLQLEERPSQYFEIIGSVQDHVDYIKKNPESQRLDKLSDFLDRTPAIRAAIHTPMATLITSEVFTWRSEKGFSLPSTMTELYIFYTMKLKQAELATSESSIADSFSSSEVISNEAFLSLCEFAFNGLKGKQQLVFPDIPPKLRDVYLGLMQEQRPLYATGEDVPPSYHFNHHTLQEFLAAKWISHQKFTPEKLSKEILSNDRFTMVVRFLAGLTQLESFPSTIIQEKIECKEHEPCNEKLTLFHWLFEAGKYAPHVLDSKVFFAGSNYTWTTLDYFVTGYAIAHSNCAWTLNFGGCLMDDEKMESFTKGLCTYDANEKRKGHITHLDLDDSDLTSKALECLNNIPKQMLCNLKHIDLSRNVLEKVSIDCVAEAFSSMTSLTFLSLWGNRDIRGGIVRLLSALVECKHLEHLQLSGASIVEEDCQQLGQLLKSSTSIKNLDICDNSLSCASMDAVVEGLHENRSLRCFTIGSVHKERACHFSEKSIKMFSEYLQDNDKCQLEKLEMGNCNFDSHAVASLAHALQANCSVKVLTLSKNSIGDDGAIAISETLRKNESLEVLELDCCDITSRGSIELASALMINKTLRELMISHNRVEDDGAKAFAQILIQNSSLETLWLHGDNSVSQEGINSLCENAEKSQCLKKIWLPATFRRFDTDHLVGWYLEL